MIPPALNRPAEILLVEDNPGDVELTAKDWPPPGSTIISTSSWTALKCSPICAVKDNISTPRGPISFCSIPVPKKDGREVLADIKADEDLHHLRWWF